ncbi:MAG TPA: DUF503 domain-containing protein [Anaerolineales bacterium]|nr:DUF503 domain-containing protein [Anaerolineales bacterium]
MALGVLTLYLYLPGCGSLKEKRSRIKPIISRLHREFNISVAEVDEQDIWQSAVIACAMISNDSGQTQRSLQKVILWLEKNWLDAEVVNDTIELI